jgi:hypothetical protein
MEGHCQRVSCHMPCWRLPTTLTHVLQHRTLPCTVDTPKNKDVYKDFFDDDSGIYDLAQSMTYDFKKPIFDPNEVVAEVCGSVAFGPALALAAQYKDDASLSAMARLDLPKVELCANLTRGILLRRSGGRWPYARELQFTSEDLHYWSPSLDVCFDISDGADDDDWSPSGTPHPLQEGNQSDDSGFGPCNSTSGAGSPG